MLADIEVQDWFGHKKAHLTLASPFTLVVGVNDAGKSSLAKDAVEFCLTGELQGRQIKRGEKLGSQVVRHGAKSASVSLTFSEDGDKQWTVTRKITRAGKQSLEFDDETVGSLAEMQSDLFSRLGLDDLTARVSLDSWTFFDRLTEAERSAVLFRAIGDSVDVERVHKMLLERGVPELTAKSFAEGAAQNGFGVSQKKAETLRAEQTGAIKAAHLEEEGQTVTIGGREIDLARIDIDAVKTSLEQAREDLGKMAASAGEDLGRAQAELASLTRKRDELQQEVEKVGGTARGSEVLKTVIEKLEADAKAAEMAVEKLREKRSQATRIATMSSGCDKPDVCPAIDRFPCPASTAALEAHAKTMAAQIDQAKKEVEEIAIELDVAEQESVDAAKALRIAKEEFDSVRESIARREIATGKLALLTQAGGPLELAQKEVARLSGYFNKEKADEIHERVSRNEELLQAHGAYLGRLQRNAEAEKRKAQADEKRSAYDAIAQAFKPDAIPRELTAEKLPVLLLPLCEMAAQMGLGDVSIDPDDLSVSLSVDGHPMVASQLSRSVRLRLSVAIQHAIASQTQLGVLIVDELEIFMPEVRPLVANALLNASGVHGSVIGISSLNKETPVCPAIEGVGMVWVKEGDVVEVPA